jgi:hypothetical protein
MRGAAHCSRPKCLSHCVLQGDGSLCSKSIHVRALLHISAAAHIDSLTPASRVRRTSWREVLIDRLFLGLPVHIVSSMVPSCSIVGKRPASTM